ncbi:RYAR-like protein [Mya arenaria]|uniref:RYAR-like protein n=1 Tax=Mya arenaria TaxID=6604 RepID=A0ABY7DHZ1_MYAAR|nr:RYamide receptor-like [Mya arenaria]WAQ95698.1 RYAR-like protein [Mya arenaria]
MSVSSLDGINNNTSREQESSGPFQISEYVQVMIIVMYTIVILIAIGGNSIVCYLVYAYKRMQTVPNYFIVNLAISDIIMALFCIPFTFIANLILNYWPFGEALCPAVLYIQTVAVFLSSYTLVAMSIDRYIVIVHPFKSRISVRQTALTIFAIWVVSFTIPLPTFIKSRVIYHSNTSGQCREEWGNNTEQYTYGLSLMILHYFAPLALLLFSYLRIGYTIWRMNIHGTDKNKRKLQLAKAKKKMIKMMVTVVIFFALCWLPFHIITLIGDINPTIYNNNYVPILWLCFHWLSMSNSCYNPMIYLWMSPKFRTGLKLAMSSCHLRRKSNTPLDDDIHEQIHVLFPRLRLEIQIEESVMKNTRPQRGHILFADVKSNDLMIPRSIHSDT